MTSGRDQLASEIRLPRLRPGYGVPSPCHLTSPQSRLRTPHSYPPSSRERSASISVQRPGSARRSRCSTRDTAAWLVAPTSSSASSRPTAGSGQRADRRRCPLIPRRAPAGTRDSASRRWMSMRSSLAAPRWLLVDELAHTERPRRRKREALAGHRELLAAGIDVISTVNIQHLEQPERRRRAHHRRDSRARRCPTASSAEPTRSSWST